MLGKISVVKNMWEEYRPFVSDESALLMSNTTRKIPRKILRDTGAIRYLMLKDISV